MVRNLLKADLVISSPLQSQDLLNSVMPFPSVLILTLKFNGNAGGDCKTLMFVQISPSDADMGETLCSLNFASRVKGIEYGPARKQADFSELLKYKHLVCFSSHVAQCYTSSCL